MANVLVVDDAAFMCMAIKQMLENNEHCMVGQAADGVEALEKFAELRPDVVIMDITMPGMNGIEALKRIKIIDPKAKVIICSVLAQQDIFAEAIELGADEFLVKPFTEDELMHAIEKVMSRKRVG